MSFYDDDLKDAPDRVDGRAKVTGKAKYIAEHKPAGMLYGYLVQSTIAKGTITSIDTAEAEKQPGVRLIVSHRNAPKLTIPERPVGARPFYPLMSADVMFNAQPIAVVVADSFEQARFAASLVKVTYSSQKGDSDTSGMFEKAIPEARPTPDRGKPVEAFAAAEVKIEAEYTIPFEHHHPMELHATVANWDGNKLTVYDKTQGTQGTAGYVAAAFGIDRTNVRVVAPFVGGAFGAALRPGPQLLIASMAAKLVGKPVKVVYSRRQLATAHGYRPASTQRIKLASDRQGELSAIIHEGVHNTSSHEIFGESLVGISRSLYACPNVKTMQTIARLDMQTPLWMRAPGAVSGAFALESALDELAYKLKIDPLQLRILNHADTDPESGKPFSSKELKECYRQGSEKFGWSKRNIEPRMMKEGRWLIGYGMATGTWFAGQSPASARVTYRANGTVLVESAATDIGPGTYTMGATIAAQGLGVPIERVTFALGDSELPPSPGQGGSTITSSVGTAIKEACEKLGAEFAAIDAKTGGSPFKDVAATEIIVENAAIMVKGKPDTKRSLADILKANDLPQLAVLHRSTVATAERAKYSIASHGAQFVEVAVDEEIGVARVRRVVQATAAGKIINPKGAHSQEMGGVVWGVGMALTEVTEVDDRYARIMNPNLAGYHVPVNADIPEIETIFVPEEDKIVNPLGAKGLGELGLVGIPAAIANAIFNATGKRLRDLPMTPDKLIA